MILWLASYPRSGNTYFRLLLKQLYGIETRSIYYPADDEGLARKLGVFSGPSKTLEATIRDPAYQIIKTHELASDDAPAIYLVRDGRDTLISHAHFHLEYVQKLSPEAQASEFETTLLRLVETNDFFGGWSGNIQSWVRRSAPTVILRYEDLIDQPVDSVRQSLAAVNFPVPELLITETTSFAQLHQLEPQFFRKGKAGAWREEMPRVMQHRFWQRHGTTMQAMGYKAPTLFESFHMNLSTFNHKAQSRIKRSSRRLIDTMRPFC